MEFLGMIINMKHLTVANAWQYNETLRASYLVIYISTVLQYCTPNAATARIHYIMLNTVYHYIVFIQLSAALNVVFCCSLCFS